MSITSQGGVSALMMASRKGNSEVVKQLLEAKANINLQDQVLVSHKLEFTAS